MPEYLPVALMVFGVCFALAFLFIAIFVWAVKSGQFHDVEGVKYRMLEDDDLKKKAGNEPPAHKS